MTCYNAVVSCPNTADLNMVFGRQNPVGTNNGTIVLMSGGGGTQPSDGIGNENGYADFYLNTDTHGNGYQVVELAWHGSDWEDTGVTTKNISTAACRPASFLWWVYNNLYVNNSNDQRGFCAQGVSAGSAAIAYSMAWYGGGGSAFPLDKVELLSGPVLSDIEQGCVEPPAVQLTVCPSGASYCNPDTPWQIAPKYVYGPQTQVATWSGNMHCAWDPQLTTTPAENQAWKAMSIVDGSRGTFSYPKTTISGWLCESVYQGQQCNGTSQYCMNNSSSQGQLFYTQVNAAGPPPNFSVYPVQTCDTAEGVSGDHATVPGKGNAAGFSAISNDMANSALQCKKNSTR